MHGALGSPRVLVGRRIADVVAAWHWHGDERTGSPVDVWLIDEERRATRVTCGSDWCLVVEDAQPYAGYDMDRYGRIEVGQLDGGSPFGRHIGEPVVAVAEEHEPRTGRVAIVLTFASGQIRCASTGGDLRFSVPNL